MKGEIRKVWGCWVMERRQNVPRWENQQPSLPAKHVAQEEEHGMNGVGHRPAVLHSWPAADVLAYLVHSKGWGKLDINQLTSLWFWHHSSTNRICITCSRGTCLMAELFSPKESMLLEGKEHIFNFPYRPCLMLSLFPAPSTYSLLKTC